MRKFTLLCTALAFSACIADAQTIATFDDLTLPGTDTFYINYSHPGADVGFNDGLAHFPCVYDSSGGVWSSSYFVYSNKTDSVTSGYTNEYSAKAGIGYAGSAKYAVAYCSNPTTYAFNMVLPLNGAAIGQPVEGFYITNSTYAYNDMRDGDGYAKKFGDTTGTGITTGQGTAPDWFKLTVKGYLGGTLGADSVDFYLADFRPAGTANDSIIRGWHWVNLLPLGHVDSLQFSLSSSDNDPTYGMKTPGYFCMDNFTTHESSLGINAIQTYAARVYPNPAVGTLNIDCALNAFSSATITDLSGNIISSSPISSTHTEINTSGLASGVYLLQLTGGSGIATSRFVKQ